MNNGDECRDLPPGFRFHPTDEEIINCYLTEKIKNGKFIAKAIGVADLNKSEPWDLPKKAKMGEKEWYFFCQRDRKYPTGMRTNRATQAGYWKATGKDKEIYDKGKGGCLVGMKKTLVFYRGRAPKGEKTNWVMHEYRLEGKNSYHHFSKTSKDEWVVCRIFHKSTGIKRSSVPSLLRMSSFSDYLLDSTASSLPSLLDHGHYLSGTSKPRSNLVQNGTGKFNETPTAGSRSGHHHLFNSGTTIDEHQKHPTPILSSNTPQQSSYYPIQQNPYLNQFSPFNRGYFNQEKNNFSLVPNYPSSNLSGHDQALLRALVANNDLYRLKSNQCKVERFSSNQSVVSLSQDTGLSTDRKTEISSVVSKNDMPSNTRSNEDMEEEPSSDCPVAGLDCLWNY
ncbi:hypothetical protein C5167_038275 [Papaver somniferum]|uniref:NAC domain-containing protein n=1 Tax=Papaver somniferum TaxID=3469 RepID=A0A4Y7IBB2_PAPSO|nr:NAC domain-containing protein 100-like isoform X2 [Papaver somniferum]RZC45326.1 hypothetical protein C5167_038275 [Papaver somniferum]